MESPAFWLHSFLRTKPKRLSLSNETNKTIHLCPTTSETRSWNMVGDDLVRAHGHTHTHTHVHTHTHTHTHTNTHAELHTQKRIRSCIELCHYSTVYTCTECQKSFTSHQFTLCKGPAKDIRWSKTCLHVITECTHAQRKAKVLTSLDASVIDGCNDVKLAWRVFAHARHTETIQNKSIFYAKNIRFM